MKTRVSRVNLRYFVNGCGTPKVGSVTAKYSSEKLEHSFPHFGEREGKPAPLPHPYLKIVRIMLQTSHLPSKFINISIFSKYTLCYQARPILLMSAFFCQR